MLCFIRKYLILVCFIYEFRYSSVLYIMMHAEAAAALGSAAVKAEEDKLAEFMVRVQARSSALLGFDHHTTQQ